MIRFFSFWGMRCWDNYSKFPINSFCVNERIKSLWILPRLKAACGLIILCPDYCVLRFIWILEKQFLEWMKTSIKWQVVKCHLFCVPQVWLCVTCSGLLVLAACRAWKLSLKDYIHLQAPNFELLKVLPCVIIMQQDFREGFLTSPRFPWSCVSLLLV